jgi:hypothetical protein
MIIFSVLIIMFFVAGTVIVGKYREVYGGDCCKIENVCGDKCCEEDEECDGDGCCGKCIKNECTTTSVGHKCDFWDLMWYEGGLGTDKWKVTAKITDQCPDVSDSDNTYMCQTDSNCNACDFCSSGAFCCD